MSANKYTVVSRRTGRTVSELVAGIGRAEIRCGLCCWGKAPCNKCAVHTKRANGEPVTAEELAIINTKSQ